MSEASTGRQADREDSLGRLIRLLETGAACGLLAGIVIVGLLQLGFQRFAGIELAWVPELLSALLLWLVMVGSTMAAGRLRHVRARQLEPYLPAPALAMLRRVTFLFSGFICLVLVWYSLHAILLEYEFRQIAFGFVPIWLIHLAVPAGFTVMAARFVAWAAIPPANSSRRRNGKGDPGR